MKIAGPGLVAAARLALASEPGRDDPGGDLRIGAAIAAVFFVVFLGWAAVTRLDAAAYAPGRVTVAGHRQSVQHRDGGIIGALYVKEGERVREGQILLQLAAAEVDAQAAALVSQVIGLQAQRARLQAEQAGLPVLPWPTEFAALSGAERERAAVAMAVQQSELRARTEALASEKNVLRRRTGQMAQKARGYRRQVEAADQQERLLGEELAGMKALEARGYAPKTRVRALERTLAEIGGQRGQYQAAIAEAAEAAGEAQMQGVALDKERSEDIANQLREVDFQINNLTPRLAAARDQLRRVRVRAPANGVVVGLSVHTVGGVIAPGQRLMEIVPDRAQLVV